MEVRKNPLKRVTNKTPQNGDLEEPGTQKGGVCGLPYKNGEGGEFGAVFPE